MAKKNDTRFFENKLLDFVAAKDPLLEMLQWVMDKFMECLEEGFEEAVPPLFLFDAFLKFSYSIYLEISQK